ncbi:hypothetical protein PENANT_c028G02694 [Penicillium antarcticum]|uniref:Uncharacterized protein n=1 Tax=Penicillium antarcticum TaxID=416450 RepID=A0A1V6PWH7_9EURO|nr:hypothetical protein PENANT_c028G02694 [Penicillium antarcticum]
MASPTAYPPGVSPPLSTDNENDHSGLIVIMTALFLVFVLISVAARAFSSFRRHVIQRDDYLFSALVAVAISQVSLVLTQVHYGWGTRKEPSEIIDHRMLKDMPRKSWLLLYWGSPRSSLAYSMGPYSPSCNIGQTASRSQQ